MLVAYVIEIDNEFEHRTPHRTTNHGSTGGRNVPWLVSVAMWFKLMRHVPAEGVAVAELRDRTRLNAKDLRMLLTRMSDWWGYVVVERAPEESKPKGKRPTMLVRPTPGGQTARDVWQSLFAVMEQRWEKRFGRADMDGLRASLEALSARLDTNLPDFLPTLGYGLFSASAEVPASATAPRNAGSEARLDLPVLLSRALLAIAEEFERETGMSMAVAANVLRIVGEDGVRVRDLPALTGVSKEAHAVALGLLEKSGHAVVASDPKGLGKTVRLTERGRAAREVYLRTLDEIDARWAARFGADLVGGLRTALEKLVGSPDGEQSPLFDGLTPHPDGWRAAVPAPRVLPHFPVVLHRGGYPDGA